MDFISMLVKGFVSGVTAGLLSLVGVATLSFKGSYD